MAQIPIYELTGEDEETDVAPRYTAEQLQALLKNLGRQAPRPPPGEEVEEEEFEGDEGEEEEEEEPPGTLVPVPVVPTGPTIGLAPLPGMMNIITAPPPEVPTLTLEDLLVQGEYEDDDFFDLRSGITKALTQLPEPKINPATAIVLGFMITKKAVYGIAYDTYTEFVIESLMGLLNR